MGDARVGEHALHVVLDDGDDVADDERKYRQHHHHALPDVVQVLQAPDQQAYDEGESGELGRGPEVDRGRGR